jgi:hypothetical protein
MHTVFSLFAGVVFTHAAKLLKPLEYAAAIMVGYSKSWAKNSGADSDSRNNGMLEKCRH